MRRVTGGAPFSFQRRVFKREGALLVRVTLNASGVRAGRQPGLLKFKTAVRVMAVATLHHSFKNFVMERFVKVGLGFCMTAHTKLRLADLQHMQR